MNKSTHCAVSSIQGTCSCGSKVTGELYTTLIILLGFFLFFCFFVLAREKGCGGAVVGPVSMISVFLLPEIHMGIRKPEILHMCVIERETSKQCNDVVYMDY